MGSELELEITGVRRGQYQVRVVHAAAGGEPAAALQLDVDEVLGRRQELETTVLASAVAARRVVPANEEPVQQVGQRLFEALFAGPVYGSYRASLGVAQERQKRLRVVLRLTSPELAQLPWETLFDPERGTYLCRHEPLVRHVPAPYTPAPLEVNPPLRLLVVIASPRGLPPLDTDAERGRLEEALADQVSAAQVELTWVTQARWDSLHGRLLDGEWHVLHFIGHGDYDLRADEGLIALVGDDGGPDLVEASRLADLLGEARPMPRLVVLNSCSSAQGGTRDVFSSTGAALVHSGINAVAAMQFTVSDRAAIRFAHGFYTALARGRRIDEAAQSGRIAILGAARTLEWITPVLYVRGDTTQLFTFTTLPVPAQLPKQRIAPQPPPPPPQVPDGGQQKAQLHAMYVMASAELRAGHHDDAIVLLDDLLTLDLNNRDAAALRETAIRQRRLAELYQCAVDAEAAGDWNTAVSAYAEILNADPGYRDAALRRDSCSTRQHVADLQGELRYLADASQWQAAIDVSEELRRLDPAAADPDGLATQARQALQEVERATDLERRYAEARAVEDTGDWEAAAARYRELAVSNGGYRDAAQRRDTCVQQQQIAALRAALDQQAAAQDWAKVRDTISRLTALDPDAAREYATLSDHAQHEFAVHPTELLVISYHSKGSKVTALSWDPSGQRIAVGADIFCHVYDSTGTERMKVVAANLSSWVSAVAFSPDGSRLATAGGRARIWDAVTGRELRKIHAKMLTEVAFSPEGSRLATGTDRHVRIWDAATGRQLLEICTYGTHSVAFSPAGSRLATASAGTPGSARIWPGSGMLLPAGSCLKSATIPSRATSVMCTRWRSARTAAGSPPAATTKP